MIKLNRKRDASGAIVSCLTLLAALTAAPSAQAQLPAAFADVEAGTSTWVEQKVVQDDGAASDNFGYAVAVSGSTAVVGAPNACVDGYARVFAYFYTLVDGTWTLQQKIGALIPRFRDVEPAFAWGGTFAETSDGLPFFGPHEQFGPRVHFAMAYGGNGITYSMIGAGLLQARIQGRRHPCANLFSFARLRRG